MKGARFKVLPEHVVQWHCIFTQTYAILFRQNINKQFIFIIQFNVNDTLVHGMQTPGCHYYPNAFLMSVLLFIGTFLMSYHLKKFRTQNFFPASVRGFISDFAVVIAISSMTLTDFFIAVETPKLSVPEQPLASVALTVKVAAVVVLGVPLKTPADVSEAQVGSVPLETV